MNLCDKFSERQRRRACTKVLKGEKKSDVGRRQGGVVALEGREIMLQRGRDLDRTGMVGGNECQGQISSNTQT
jgi:hypothetical protein